MHTKSYPAAVKAVGGADGLEDGQFEAIVSVFDNVDSYGDIVRKGAFADTLAEWKASGNPIPVYWSHRMADPDFNIGHVLEAKEVDEGLWVKAQLDLDGPKSQQVHRLLKGKRVTQFSFAYEVVDGGFVKQDDEEFYELRKLRVYEVGPTPIGANQETELLAVKSNAGGPRSIELVFHGQWGGEEKKSISTAVQTTVGENAPPDGGAGNDGKATADQSSKAEEPEGAKAEDSQGRATADLSALDALALELELSA